MDGKSMVRTTQKNLTKESKRDIWGIEFDRAWLSRRRCLLAPLVTRVLRGIGARSVFIKSGPTEQAEDHQ